MQLQVYHVNFNQAVSTRINTCKQSDDLVIKVSSYSRGLIFLACRSADLIKSFNGLPQYLHASGKNFHSIYHPFLFIIQRHCLS